LGCDDAYERSEIVELLGSPAEDRIAGDGLERRQQPQVGGSASYLILGRNARDDVLEPDGDLACLVELVERLLFQRRWFVEQVLLEMGLQQAGSFGGVGLEHALDPSA
jgi:hypothetical protein